jgi:integrase
VLDAKQVGQLLTAARGDRLFALYALAVTTGLRQGELLGLQWEDIDLKVGSLAVRHILEEDNHTGVRRLAEPKTATSRRRVEIPRVAVAALRAHRKRAFAKGEIGGLIFRDTDGGPLRKGNLIRRSFKPLLTKAKLPSIRFHDLRHTAATLLLAEGVNPKVVQERLGHAQIHLTLDTYSHVLPSMQKDATARLDRLLARVLK